MSRTFSPRARRARPAIAATAVTWAALAAAALAVLVRPAHAVPVIDRPVTDLAGVLSPAEVDTIAAALVAHRARTGVQMAVLVVSTTKPAPIEDYAHQVAERWGGGQAGADNGALFVLAIGDRRMRLEVGYGLEPVIPDSRAKRIIDAIRPYLQGELYGPGIQVVVDGVIAATADLRPGEGIPASLRARLWLADNYLLHFVLGIALGVATLGIRRLVVRAWKPGERKDKRRRATRKTAELSLGNHALILLGCAAAWAVIVIAVGAWTGGAWMWNPLLTGYGIGCGVLLWIAWALRGLARWVLGIFAVGVCVSIAVLVHHHLHRIGPNYHGTSEAESTLLLFLVIIGFIAFAFVSSVATGGGTTLGSSGSSSSSSYSSDTSSWSSSSSSFDSSSSSSSSSSYSGGGGSFGGGGASSSW